MEIENDELYARATFGQQVQAFWDSDVGGYLRTRARECYTAAIRELKSCDPADWKNVAKLQGEVWRSESFEDWLSEGILDGLKSLDLLEADEDPTP